MFAPMRDVAHFTDAPSITGQKDIICVQDMYSRKFYTVALDVNTPSATSTDFRVILAEVGTTPNHLNTDQGAEFTSGAFPILLDEQGISHNAKDTIYRQYIPTIDRAIKSLKTNLMKGGSPDPWSSRLAVVTTGMKVASQYHILGSAPNHVPQDAQLQFHLKKDAAEAVIQNDKVVRGRENRLNADGACRVVDPSGDIRHNLKFISLVPRGSASVPDQPMARRGAPLLRKWNAYYLSYMHGAF